MTEEGDMRELLGRVIATQESHGRELGLLRAEVKDVGQKVAQHRTGWQIFMWIGGTGIALAALFLALWRDG